MQITGVVLAGGKSLRMKTDKALIEFKGKTLLEYQVNLLSSVFDNVLISANTKAYSFVNKKIIADWYQEIGPMGGILSVLQKIDADAIFVLSVDMPLVSKELIKYIISQQNNYDIVLPVFNGKYEPTCAIYSKKCIETIENQLQSKDYKLINFIKKSNTKFVNIDKNLSFYKENLFVNLNSIEDLDKL